MNTRYRLVVSLFALLVIIVPNVAYTALTVGATSVTSDAALTMNAVANTADAIYLHANGGIY